MLTNRVITRISFGLTRSLGYRSTFIRFNSSNAKDSVLARYTQKLEERAKDLGLQNINDLQEKYKEEIENKKKEFNSIDPLEELEEYERRKALEIKEENDKTIKVRSPISKDTPQQPYKVLNSFLDLEKAKDLGPKELEFIWRARFQKNERSLVALLDNIQFANMYANAFKNPSFILPLPKNGDGYEMHFVQWSFVGPKTTHCMLTTVAEYKLHKEYAKPHTTLMFHQELGETSEVVLMNGQVETESSLNMDEAQLLVLNVQRFYGGIKDYDNTKKLALLRGFTSGNTDFNLEELIAEASSMD